MAKLEPTKVFSLFQPREAFVWLPNSGARGRPQTCLVGKQGKPDLKRGKVAAFDLDGTLIKPKSGNIRPGTSEDWMFWHNSVPKKLKEAHEAGYQVVIFSNQNYRQDSNEARSFNQKLKMLGPAINVPFYLFAGFEKDCHRKPMIGMWELFKEVSGAEVDLQASYYVGDAAGRMGDHADTDRKVSFSHT